MEQQRSQFTFYESFFKALARIRKDADRAKAYDAICKYALYGEEADINSLPDSAAVAYEIAVPVLKASRKKSKAGKKGGEAKTAEANASKLEANASKLEANASKLEARAKPKQEKEQVQVQVQDKEQMLNISPPPPIGVVGDIQTTTPPEARGVKPKKSGAVDAYMRLISPTPSTTSMQELLEYERKMDTACCLKAIDAALDASAHSWHYVRQVLEDKLAQGVKTVEDWERLDTQRMATKRHRTQQRAQEAAAPEIDTSDTDRLWEKLHGAGGETP